jgi:hypothetical protein
MPQGDDYITSAPTPAPAPVDETPPAAPASVPEVDDDAAAAPADPETPATPQAPDETPEQAQKRADRAFAAMRRANETQAARIAALEARLPPPVAATGPAPPPPPPPAEASDTAPQPETFATHADYVQAVATWAVQQHERTKEATATATSLQTAWEAQEAQAKAKFADYDEVLAADTVRYHPAVLQAIQTSDQGAEVAYHLATHPADAARLTALAPVAALRALGRLEAQLEAPPVAAAASPDPTPPPPPKPRPLAPVGGAGSGGSTVSPDQLSYEDYTAWYVRTYGSR